MFDPETLLEDARKALAHGRLEEARDLYAQAVAESRFVKAPALQAKALKALGKVERDLRHRETALQCYRESARLSLELGDRLEFAHSVRHAADVLVEMKRLPEAAHSYNDALGVYGAHPETSALDHANAFRGFARLQESLGETETALRTWQQALLLYEEAGIEAGSAQCRSNIAFLMGR